MSRGRTKVLWQLWHHLLGTFKLHLKAPFQPWCFARRDTSILNFVWHEITEFLEVVLHRSFPKQSLEEFPFSCCKYVLFLSFFIFLKLFCKYSVYIHKFCSVKTVCLMKWKPLHAVMLGDQSYLALWSRYGWGNLFLISERIEKKLWDFQNAQTASLQCKMWLTSLLLQILQFMTLILYICHTLLVTRPFL